MNKYTTLRIIEFTSILFISVFAGLAGFNHNEMVQTRHQYETAITCAQATKTKQYKNCYTVEALYNTEYVCTSDNITCWVESK
jgi:hypothetical protein